MKIRTYESPTSEDVAIFLHCIDHDQIVAMTSPHRGIFTEEETEASAKVYRWLKYFAEHGNYPAPGEI